MYSIELNNNRVFKWQSNNGVSIKSTTVGNIDVSFSDESGFVEIINSIKSNFAIVAEDETNIFAAVDRVRSIPLFYYKVGDKFIIGDTVESIKQQTKSAFLNNLKEEFLYTGYTTGKCTLLKDVYQLQAGEYLIFNKKENHIKVVEFFSFTRRELYDSCFKELSSKLTKVHETVFNRVKKLVNNYNKVVVPLSGGYDSRLMLHLLKEARVENVLCFTYGRKGNNEIEISKKVAAEYGFEWIFIEYSEKKWKDALNSKEFDNYSDYASNYSTLSHIQDFVAVKELKEKKLIPQKSVFLPGHAYDFLAGSHISYEFVENKSFSKRKLNNLLFLKHFSFIISPIFILKLKFNKIFFENKEYSSSKSISELEKWNWRERQSKFIVNSVRLYEFFGYGWALPFWDYEIIDFWQRISIELRYKRKFFKEYFNHISISKSEISQDIIKFKFKEDIKNHLGQLFLFRYFKNVFSALFSYTPKGYVLFGVISKKEFVKNAILHRNTTVNSTLAKRYLKSKKLIR